MFSRVLLLLKHSKLEILYPAETGKTGYRNFYINYVNGLKHIFCFVSLNFFLAEKLSKDN